MNLRGNYLLQEWLTVGHLRGATRSYIDLCSPTWCQRSTLLTYAVFGKLGVSPTRCQTPIDDAHLRGVRGRIRGGMHSWINTSVHLRGARASSTFCVQNINDIYIYNIYRNISKYKLVAFFLWTRASLAGPSWRRKECRLGSLAAAAALRRVSRWKSRPRNTLQRQQQSRRLDLHRWRIHHAGVQNAEVEVRRQKEPGEAGAQ